MQREKLIAVGIAIALQTYYVPAIAPTTTMIAIAPLIYLYYLKKNATNFQHAALQTTKNKTTTGDGWLEVSQHSPQV